LKYISFSVVIAFLTIGCTTNDDGQTSPVQLRLTHVSPFDYSDISIRNNVPYEDLEGGSMSEYQTFDSSYSFMFVKLVIDQDTLTIQPIDFDGESLIPSGNYTYEISADFEHNDFGSLNAVLVRD
jgi:hypothetical protein